MPTLALPKRSARARLPLLPALLLVGLASLSGPSCSAERASPDLSPAQALRRRFPEQARAVLEPSEAFVARDESFTLGAPPARGGAFHEAEVALPRDGRAPIRFRGFG